MYSEYTCSIYMYMYKNSCMLNLSLAISCMSKDSIIKIKDNGVLILLIIELNGTIKIN